MYKQIQLTNKELKLLASIIHYYIDQKREKPGFEINNAHIMLRHIIGITSQKDNNQIAFSGKWTHSISKMKNKSNEIRIS